MLDISKNLDVYKKLVDKCSQKVENFGKVSDFFVHGSRATNKFHAGSDLDLCFVVDGGETEVESFKVSIKELFECKDVGVYYLNGERWNFWMYRGKEVGVHVYTKDEINKRVDQLYESFVSFENISPWIQHTIRESCPVFEKDGSLGEWKRKAESFSESFFVNYRKTYLDYLSGKVEWMKLRPVWKGVAEERLDTYYLYEVLIKCHYAFNPQVGFYMPGAKNYVFDTKEMTPDITVDLEELIWTVNNDYRNTLVDKQKQMLILERINSKFFNTNNFEVSSIVK